MKQTWSSTSMVPLAVSDLRQRIERWRRERSRRTPMPADLWRGAVELAKHHGVYQVSQALRVSYDALKSRIVEERDMKRGREGCRGFVEVVGHMGKDGGDGLGCETEVEIVRCDGALLRLRHKGGGVELAAVVEAFGRSRL